MMKTVVIAVCSAVAYLAVVIGLTIYCSIRLVKAKNLRKAREAEAAPPLIGKGVFGCWHVFIVRSSNFVNFYFLSVMV